MSDHRGPFTSLPIQQLMMRAQAPYSIASPSAPWFWIVGNHNPDTEVFSVQAGDYVPNTDPDYVAWVAAGNLVTNIPTDGELADVITTRGLPAMAIRNAGWTDWGYVPPLSQLAVATASGVHIVSTGTPAISGVYAIDTDMRVRINTNVDYINRHNAFSPNEASTKDWPDVTGALHTFTDTSDFLNFATAIADYYAQMNDWAMSGGGGEPPHEPLTIA